MFFLFTRNMFTRELEMKADGEDYERKKSEEGEKGSLARFR